MQSVSSDNADCTRVIKPSLPVGLKLRSPGTPTPVILVMTKPVILIVEENALVRAAVAERLRAAGFEVIAVATSAEGDCVLRTTLVDALIQTTSAA